MERIFALSTSTPWTCIPLLARHTPVESPTYPRPTTETLKRFNLHSPEATRQLSLFQAPEARSREAPRGLLRSIKRGRAIATNATVPKGNWGTPRAGELGPPSRTTKPAGSVIWPGTPSQSPAPWSVRDILITLPPTLSTKLSAWYTPGVDPQSDL